ncbi:hypothetical protein [Pedobacter sp. SYSU D00535]|uniref:hypothetical protein n=1 Tax=Pedobacter sp. SYSU D00535 TaxID=2810308 RepID=UPI001A969530|nr:hypothetical protein [Pedobacter sp. SYSU D00535]
MKATNYLGILGAALLIAGALSPLLKLPLIGFWQYWDLEPVLASTVYLLAAAGFYSSLRGKNGLVKILGWVALVVVLFTLAAVYFKINDSFSFIPMKKLAASAARLVKYQWTGWLLLIAGSLLMIVAGRKSENKKSGI